MPPNAPVSIKTLNRKTFAEIDLATGNYYLIPIFDENTDGDETSPALPSLPAGKVYVKVNLQNAPEGDFLKANYAEVAGGEFKKWKKRQDTTATVIQIPGGDGVAIGIVRFGGKPGTPADIFASNNVVLSSTNPTAFNEQGQLDVRFRVFGKSYEIRLTSKDATPIMVVNYSQSVGF
jgi:hypothetical protein